MKSFPYFLIGVAAFTLIPFYTAQAEEPVQLYRPNVVVGGKLGSQRDIGETSIIIPLAQAETSILYGDYRIRDESGPGMESNIGIGYRQIVHDAIMGGYIMGDYRETPNYNSLRQLTIGGEVLTENHDARINVYLPERGKKSVFSGAQTVQVGTQILVEGVDSFEKASSGFDVELGQKIPFAPFDLRFYAAGYHFFQDEGADMTGARVRLRATSDDINISGQDIKFQFETEAQHDNIRDDSYFCGGRIILPFGKKASRPLTPLQERMTEKPQRDIDVVVANQTKIGPAVAATATINGQSYSEVHDLDLQTDDLATTISALPEHALIRIKSSAPQLITSAISLKDGQALVGGDQVLNVNGSGGRTTTLAGDAFPSHLVKATAIGATNPLIVLPNDGNASIYDMTFTNESGATGDTNVMISSLSNPVGTVDIRNIYSEGSLIVESSTGNSTISVTDSTIYGGVFRTRTSAIMNLTVNNNEFHRSYARAEVFNQNITSSLFIEAMNTSTMNVVSVSNNIITDEKAKVGGRPALGLGFVQSSSTPMAIDALNDNTISRTGAWDAGAILTQGTGGDIINLSSVHGNSGEVHESVATHLNIGQVGVSANGTGYSAANNGMTFGDYGGNIITNTTP